MYYYCAWYKCLWDRRYIETHPYPLHWLAIFFRKMNLCKFSKKQSTIYKPKFQNSQHFRDSSQFKMMGLHEWVSYWCSVCRVNVITNSIHNTPAIYKPWRKINIEVNTWNTSVANVHRPEQHPVLEYENKKTQLL